MSFLFKSRPKTPTELVQIMCEASRVVMSGDSNLSEKVRDKAVKDLTKSLTQLKAIFNENESNAELVAELAQESYATGLLEIMVDCMPYYDFEARKSVAIVFNGILKRQIGSRTPTADYIYNHQDILHKLLNGYGTKDIALNCGMMLRECLLFDQLAQVFIESDAFYKLFAYIELPTFDIASDAFATFETLLVKHKMFTATLFVESYDKIMPEFTKLLISENYVTRRQSLKLLVELLFDPVNEETMRRFLSSSDNLKIVMNLMRDSSRTISTEAIRVFRAFLDNPTRPKAVHDILLKNQEKLMFFMENFNHDLEDEEIIEDKEFCIAVIGDLVPRPDASNTSKGQPEIS